ncbi:Acb2/Tad1 domain-containing protein [Paenibacillus sp. CMM36]
MYKCIDYYSGVHIGELNEVSLESDFEYFYNDYTYKLKYIVSNVAFFTKYTHNTILENNFSYHSPKDGQIKKYIEIRVMVKDLAYLIEELVPSSREKSLAMTNLEQAVFWANAAIARNE